MLIATWLILFVAPLGWANRVQNTAATRPFSDELTTQGFSTSHSLHAYDQYFDWMPAHRHVWIESDGHQPAQQYANWEHKRVTIYQPTLCSTGDVAHWSIPRLNVEGYIEANDRWTEIPIDLPPFTNEITTTVSCSDYTSTMTWERTTDRKIPQLYWKPTENGSLQTILHNGHGLIVDVSVRGDFDWIHFTRLYATHPIEPWVLPSLSFRDVRLQVRDAQTVLIDHTVQTSSMNSSVNTFPVSTPFTLPMQNTKWVSIESPTQINTTLYSYQKRLDYTASVVGLHWLQNEMSENADITPLWIYDGVWRWFAEPMWGNAAESTRLQAFEDIEEAAPIPFIRWNDTLLQETRHVTQHSITKTTKPISGSVALSSKYNLLLSPEDRIEFQLDTLSLMSSKNTIDLSSTADASGPWMLSTDSRISDARLVSLLPFTLMPLTASRAAQTLHHVALFWTPIQNRSLPWFEELLNASERSLTFLETLSADTWNALDIETKLFIVWASLTADNEGLSPSTSLMRRNLEWLCTPLKPEHSHTQALLSHVRWMVSQSHWKHRSCSTSDSHLAFEDNPISIEPMQLLSTQLQEAWEHRSLTDLPHTTPDWMTWILLEKEQDKQHRYANIRVKLQSNTQSIRGLFHEWQIRPVRQILEPTMDWNLSAQGVGRLYIGLWRPSVVPFPNIRTPSLSIQRTLYTDKNKQFDPLTAVIGKPIVIQTTVEAAPNTRFCIRQWHAAGLAHNTAQERHFCNRTNEDGLWTEIDETHIVFDGRFRLPAATVATDTELAHTETIWFETQGYKELMSE